ncbi:hypothetical protein D9758_003994 [Tetrapyrgos nigripes]|uniref:BZIP domain-containing protein n=1 Tax=Tetrapyrgos nigripes TaxID=182062 RepID=A0A8H5GLJ0_9AGAR|nr:hypothetical protein D9758_003994 [Tetrapyrgos nigripes]
MFLGFVPGPSMSSSKRGRKRNDTLPPNRARDVQRAFRARRAAHLQALEQRVSDLEEENTYLRQALNLPPANRPPLGKGPTGKDKAKPFDTSPAPPLSLRSRESSSADSPDSTRVSSHSPSQVSGLPSSHVDDVSGSQWDQPILLHEHPQSDMSSSSASSSYPLPPLNIPAIPSKPVQYNPYPSSIPSTSRSPVYMNSSQTDYPHSADRPMTSTYNSPTFTLRNSVRTSDDARTYYSYASHDDHLHASAAVISAPLHTHHRDTSLPYPSRRAMTDPQSTYTSDFTHIHLPSPHSIRLPSPPQGLQDGRGTSSGHIASRHTYETDGRVSGMS